MCLYAIAYGIWYLLYHSQPQIWVAPSPERPAASTRVTPSGDTTHCHPVTNLGEASPGEPEHTQIPADSSHSTDHRYSDSIILSQIQILPQT